MSADDTGFLSRWARRKAQVRQGLPVVEPPATPLPDASSALPVPGASTAPPLPVASTATKGPPGDDVPAEAPPTLDDVAALDARSADFSRFVGHGVDPQVKHAALRKLFSDPHFNVMDGLDTYIDDYSRPDPLPAGMLRQMAQSKLLGLFADEADPPDPPSTQEAVPPEPHENADLRLQPDDAAGRPGPGPGAGEDAGREP